MLAETLRHFLGDVTVEETTVCDRATQASGPAPGNAEHAMAAPGLRRNAHERISQVTTHWVVKTGNMYLQSWSPWTQATHRQTRAHRFLDYATALGAADVAGKHRTDLVFRPVLVRERANHSGGVDR